MKFIAYGDIGFAALDAQNFYTGRVASGALDVRHQYNAEPRRGAASSGYQNPQRYAHRAVAAP
jgi:hypothetical protein